MEASDVSWRVVAGRRSRLPPSGRRFRAFLSCGSAPPPTWAQSASYIRRSKWSDGVDAAVASPDTPTLNRLRRAPRDAVIADETPTLEKWRRPSSDFSLSTASRPVDGLRRCRRRGRSNLVWLGVCGHFDQSKFRANPGIPESPTRAWQTLGLLVSPLLIGFFLLVPGQSRTVLAWELIVSAVLLGAGQVAIDRRSVRSEKDTPLPLVGRLAGFVGAIAPALVSYACLTVAGATLLAQGGSGFYWLVPSVLLAFFFGLINPGRCLWVSRSSRSTYFHYSPATCPNRTSSAQYCPATGRRGQVTLLPRLLRLSRGGLCDGFGPSRAKRA